MAFAANYNIRPGSGRRASAFNPNVGSMEAQIQAFEINYHLARKEFLQFLTDLWVSIVRQAAFWPGGNHRPAPIETLFAKRDMESGRIMVGWDNYPSEARSPGSARIRFEHIAGVWAGNSMEYAVSFFNAETFENGLRSDVARQRMLLDEKNIVNIYTGQKRAAGRGRSDNKSPFQVNPSSEKLSARVPSRRL